ncbi:MAG: AAA family ATPase [Methylococcales bacterium]|nr:AAA family ATPase [Methylococcales bacterium]
MKQKDALEILKQGHNVLLTGFAGSGKSFLLEKFAYWARYNNENIVMTATTGIAATNINGKTIHNYSNLGISERIDLENQERVISLANNMRQPYKKSVINTDILVIDEISMLHDYQLSAVDKIIRTIRNNDSPFGGLQVILCGDFFQLPAIAKKNGKTNFITQSDSYINGNFKVCYLEENWRQQDEKDPLVIILNAIRSNTLSNQHYALLEKRISTKLSEQNTTKLYCTHNRVDYDNNKELKQLATNSRCYKWEENGDATELKGLREDNRNKIVENLELKIGTLVMFVKNNLNLGYSNGTTGKVVSFDNNGYPNIELNSGKILYSIKQDDFYREDEYGKRLATIKQIPLKLAWAITIHKSQGMTLDKAIIDLTDAFIPNQGYVALSRVRSIDDISLIGLNRKALTVSKEALNIENELQEKSKQALECLTIEKPDSSEQVLSQKNIKFIAIQAINKFPYGLIKDAYKKIKYIFEYVIIISKSPDIDRIKIVNVTIVNGSSFRPNWRRDMQRIETDKGIFIDNITKYNGFDWKSRIGEFVTDYKIIKSCGYNWLNKTNNEAR